MNLLWNARTRHTRAPALVRAFKAATRRRTPKWFTFHVFTLHPSLFTLFSHFTRNRLGDLVQGRILNL
jgi:hypothetical protein